MTSGCYEYCLMKLELGGQASNEIGSCFGKGAKVKKSSHKIYSMVALLDGSLMSILEINFLIVLERGIESGKL